MQRKINKKKQFSFPQNQVEHLNLSLVPSFLIFHFSGTSIKFKPMAQYRIRQNPFKAVA